MKRILIIAMIMMLALMQVAAAVDSPGQTELCDDGDAPLKFETGIPTELDFDNVTVGDTFMLPIPGSTGYVEIEITAVKSGTEAIAFDWTSDETVCKYLVKAGQDSSGWIEVQGATSGSGVTPTTAAISHISFCFGCDGGITEVPEFPTIAIPIAAIIGLAFFMQRRKE